MIRLQFLSPIGIGLLWLAGLTDAMAVMQPESTANLHLQTTTSAAVVALGSTFEYTLIVTNSGPDTATNVQIDVSLAQGLEYRALSAVCVPDTTTATCTIETLNSADSLQLVFIVQALALDEEMVCNASVTAHEIDPDPGNNFASATVAVRASQPTDLALSKIVDLDEIGVGQTATFNLTVSNRGPADAFDVQVVDWLPPQLVFIDSETCVLAGRTVRCNLGWIGPADEQTVSFTAQAVASHNPVVNAAYVVLAQTDLDETNNSASAKIVVLDPAAHTADLVLSIVAPISSVITGESLDLIFAVTNEGPALATEVQILSEIPETLTSLTSPDCITENGTIACFVGDLEVGQTVTRRLSAAIGVTADSLFISASVVGDQADSNLLNNSVNLTLMMLNLTATPSITPAIVVVTATAIDPPPVTATVTPTPPLLLAATALSGPQSGGGSEYSVEATDAAPSQRYGWRRYESFDWVQVTGRWYLRSLPNASDGGYHETRDSGAILRYPFQGDGFRIGFRSTVHGAPFQIRLDGEALAMYETDFETIDSNLDPPRQTLVTQPYFVPPGYHVVDVVSLADGAGSQNLNIDFIEIFVGPPMPLRPTDAVTPVAVQAITNIELILAPPSPAPTATPRPWALVTVDVFVAVDLNHNGQIEPEEGVRGLSIKAVEVKQNVVVVSAVTDITGYAQIRTLSASDLALVIPLLGEAYYVKVGDAPAITETWSLRLDPANQPGLIP